jgi:hypothetical protein
MSHLTQIQSDQLQRNLQQALQDLAHAKRQMDAMRQMIIGLGQAFVPEAFANLTSDEGAARLKDMEAGEIVALIMRYLGEKIAKLTAFNAGLSPEQRERWIRRVLESDPADWVNDPALAQLRQQLEREQQARLAAEQAAREAEARARQVEVRQAESAIELMRLRNEIKTLQEQMRQSHPTPPTGPVSAEIQDSPVNNLVLVLATRGICERPRIAEILSNELGLAESVIAKSIETAVGQGWLEIVQPRNETGVGRAPHLVRLTEAGKEFARQNLKVEPTPSELDRLLKMHDTPEHVLLILQTRILFLEKYPEVKDVDIFPAAAMLDGGKRSEPDLTVTLADGRILLVECERSTPKNESQRTEKWSKYFQATHGEFYIVCPDPKTLSLISTEIVLWQLKHGGKVRLRMTSINQVLNNPAQFWAYDRTLG